MARCIYIYIYIYIYGIFIVWLIVQCIAEMQGVVDLTWLRNVSRPSLMAQEAGFQPYIWDETSA